MSKLERNIRRKWKKHLPVVDVLFENIKAKDIQFNPVNFYKDYDSKKYLELLILWKEKNEKEHLRQDPDLSLTDIKKC